MSSQKNFSKAQLAPKPEQLKAVRASFGELELPWRVWGAVWCAHEEGKDHDGDVCAATSGIPASRSHIHDNTRKPSPSFRPEYF